MNTSRLSNAIAGFMVLAAGLAVPATTRAADLTYVNKTGVPVVVRNACKNAQGRLIQGEDHTINPNGGWTLKGLTPGLKLLIVKVGDKEVRRIPVNLGRVDEAHAIVPDPVSGVKLVPMPARR